MNSVKNKAIILAFGILVALAILIASVYFKDTDLLNENTSGNVLQKKTKTTGVIKKILEKASSKVQL
jgi:hypothetical protein